MKKLLSILLFTGFLIPVFAQAPYAGGAGDGYASESMNIVISSVNERASALPTVRIFPNPVLNNANFNIEIKTINNGKVWISIMNSNGKVVLEKVCDNNKTIRAQFPAGFYFINIKTENGEVRKKLVVFN